MEIAYGFFHFFFVILLYLKNKTIIEISYFMTIKNTIEYINGKLISTYHQNEIRSLTNIILENILGLSKTEVLISDDIVIPQNTIDKINSVVKNLQNNKPIQQILGETEFFDLKFQINNNVLIPRQETEELIDWILKDSKDLNRKLNIIDIGTGSGCIAISLAKNITNSNITAVDISEKAIELAITNAKINDVKVNFVIDDFLNTKISEKYNVIVSNPPYIRKSEKDLMHKNVLDHEPHNALFVNDGNPFIFYLQILDFAIKQDLPNTIIYFEINEFLHAELKQEIINKGVKDFEFKKDINGKYRMLKIMLK